MSAVVPEGHKILPLRPRARPRENARASRAAARVRTNLSLLQGYAEIMEGLSPNRKAQILRVMAERSKELAAELQPFLMGEKNQRPPISTYRQVRERSRQLLADYRFLLERLRESVPGTAEGSARKGGCLGKSGGRL